MTSASRPITGLPRQVGELCCEINGVLPRSRTDLQYGGRLGEYRFNALQYWLPVVLTGL
jgi:hypothetical protein